MIGVGKRVGKTFFVGSARLMASILVTVVKTAVTEGPIIGGLDRPARAGFGV